MPASCGTRSSTTHGRSAEPGVLFWDTIIRESVPDCYADEGFTTVSTNPCGEIPLCPYDSCRLLAINLLSYVDEPFTGAAHFNFDRFRDHIRKAMHMMDDIIDLELEKVELIIKKIEDDPEDEDVRRVEHDLWVKIREMALKGRRTGLGITAEGDMLAALGLRYGSEEAIAFAVEVHKTSPSRPTAHRSKWPGSAARLPYTMPRRNATIR